jgi:uracil-DNA glycosylase
LLAPVVVVCLGGVAWNSVLGAMRELGETIPRPKPKFSHGGELALSMTTLLGCYHVSQQNTFTGRLTEAMIDEVLHRAKRLAEQS